MKNRVLTFIIGILVGAIIATLGFYIYARTLKNNMQQPPMMDFKSGQMKPEDMGEMRERPFENMSNNEALNNN